MTTETHAAQPSHDAAPRPSRADATHQNASPFITPTPAPTPRRETQTTDRNQLASRITPESPREVMHAPAAPAAPAPPDPFALTPRQLNALDLLLSGLPDTHVAHLLRINRSTLYRWRTYHPAFIAELNRRRLESWDACHQRLRHLLPRALATLGRGLNSDDLRLALQSARTILANASPAPDKLPPSSRASTTPMDFIDSCVLARRRQRGKDPDKPISDIERQTILDHLLDNLQEM